MIGVTTRGEKSAVAGQGVAMSPVIILLVEDDALMRRSLTFSLEQASYRVNTAATAEDGLAPVRRSCASRFPRLSGGMELHAGPSVQSKAASVPLSAKIDKYASLNICWALMVALRSCLASNHSRHIRPFRRCA